MFILPGFENVNSPSPSQQIGAGESFNNPALPFYPSDPSQTSPDYVFGLSGYSGAPGQSGYSGWSGYSGSGVSGWSGYSGSGDSGWSGYSGQSGESTSGWSGYSGWSGAKGLKGDTGATGSQGPAGAGISGFSGYSGKSGHSGQNGQSGWSGYSGERGLDGDGKSGDSGWSGYSGEAGQSGWSGYSGESGQSGWSGYSGSGVSGWSGYSGSGVSGWSGYPGEVGQSGWSGYSGSGVSGWSGYSGQNGASTATAVSVDTTNFTKNLTSAENTVQKALDKIDDMSSGGLTNFTESTGSYSSVYYVALSPNNAQTNVNIVLQPKGTGSILAQTPDGTATGGNSRGSGAVDLQLNRSSASQIASANNSFVAGYGNTASGSISVSVGYLNTSSGSYSFSCNRNNTASESYTFSCGLYNQSYLIGQFSFGSNYTSGKVRQPSFLSATKSTTDATATEMFLDNSSARAVLKNNATWTFIATIEAVNSADITKSASFIFEGRIRRGANAAATVLSMIDVKIENSALACTATLTADTTNGSLKLGVTGIASTTILWQALVILTEIEI